MSPILLSPELCSRIVRWVRRSDLQALCLTCKAFQPKAETKLYEVILLGDPDAVYRVCKSIVSKNHLGPHVRTFFIYHDQQRPQQRAYPPLFWDAVHSALAKMPNLDTVLIYDPTISNTWIFDPNHVKFQLREAKLHLVWDARIVHFLETQKKLRSLQVLNNPAQEKRAGIHPKALRSLEIFDGPLLVAAELLSSPLTHLQAYIGNEARSQLLSVIPHLAKTSRTLRALNLLDIPEDLVNTVTLLISTACPGLHFLGILPLPTHNRHTIHLALTSMHGLQALEVDVTQWNPPLIGTFQRTVAAELRIYCPSIRSIKFWIGLNRFFWTIEADVWSCKHDICQYRHNDGAWTE